MMQNNSQINSVQPLQNENRTEEQNGGYKIHGVPHINPQPVQPIKKISHPVAVKQNNNHKKIPQQQPQQQPQPQPQPQPQQQPNINAPKKTSSKSRSRSSRSSSSSKTGNQSSNKDNKSHFRSSRKPKHHNDNQHIIAKLFGKNVNHKELHDLLQMLK